MIKMCSHAACVILTRATGMRADGPLSSMYKYTTAEPATSLLSTLQKYDLYTLQYMYICTLTSHHGMSYMYMYMLRCFKKMY